jgi:HEAT repeat protein
MVTTEDVLAVVARSPQNWGRGRREWLETEIAKLEATPEETVTAALVGLDDDDRNVRVRAVWVLWLFPDPRATEGIVRALRDPARRVREVAMKCAAPHHVGDPAVVEVLRRITEDDREIDRLRRTAFFVLSSVHTREALPDVASESLRDLMESQRFRSSILERLCKTRAGGLDEASRSVLQEFVRTGTKEEAVMATRALCGQVLVAVNRWLPPEQRQRLRDQYDPGPGDQFAETCWMPVADAIELAKAVGYPYAP